MASQPDDPWIATYPSRFDDRPRSLRRDAAGSRPARRFRHPRDWSWAELLRALVAGWVGRRKG